MLGHFGCLGVAVDGLVEPALLLLLSVGEVEHQAVEKVGMADEQAEVVVPADSFLGEFAAGSVGKVVSLGQRHLLLLCWRRLTADSGDWRCWCGGGRELISEGRRHLVDGVIWLCNCVGESVPDMTRQ